jgi:glycosyltransferase involved in cell wall biosynthesis
MKANKFSIVMPVRNAELEIARSLYSIWCQTHSNWKIIVVDDASEDNTLAEIKRFQSKFSMTDDQLTVITSQTQNYALPNILRAIEETDDDDIICHVDGDDWICDMDALSLINMRYEKSPEIQALWTAQRWGFSNYNISGPLAPDADPYTHPWVSSHMKTFRAGLFHDIKDENFRDESGEYFQRVADQAFYLPVLHKAAGNWFYEPITAYHYSIDIQKDTFQSEDAKFQKREVDFLRIRGFIS